MPAAAPSLKSPANQQLERCWAFRSPRDLCAKEGRERSEPDAQAWKGAGAGRSLCACATSALPAASAQDGDVGLPSSSCLRGHEGTVRRCAPVPRESARRQERSPGGCDGRGGGQAGRAAVHQRGSRARQRRGPGLLPDLSVSAVGGHGRHSRPHRPLRLHLLSACLRPALPAPNPQSGKEVEQIF